MTTIANVAGAFCLICVGFIVLSPVALVLSVVGAKRQKRIYREWLALLSTLSPNTPEYNRAKNMILEIGLKGHRYDDPVKKAAIVQLIETDIANYTRR